MAWGSIDPRNSIRPKNVDGVTILSHRAPKILALTPDGDEDASRSATQKARSVSRSVEISAQVYDFTSGWVLMRECVQRRLACSVGDSPTGVRVSTP